MGGGELDGRVAIVTGAAQGMGWECAHLMASNGAKIIINDIHPEGARAAAAKLVEEGASAVACDGDVTVADNVEKVIDCTLSNFGALHILVNSAGILRSTAIEEISVDEWDLMMAVNLKGVFLCSQYALAPMREAGWGRIINFSSTAGKNISTLGGAHYTASKAGVLGLTRHFAKDVAASGITVNAVCPGLIETPMVRENIGQDQIDAYARSFPIGRLGYPGEVAELVAFLASDRAAYITGASLDINGGDLMI